MTIVEEPSRPAPRFSESLRSATWSDHQRAERARYIRALVNGELDREGYAAMVDQHWHIYAVLEDAADQMRTDDVAAGFVTDDLTRRSSLEADLVALRGSAWREQSTALPATVAYCDRLREVCFSWSGGFVAHHYTRYLGDLSGGQFIGRVVEEQYGLAGAAGASFYRFDAIPDAAAFRESYRERLDSIDWPVEEQDRIIEEIGLAYHHNTAVFDDLAVACGLEP